MALAETAQLIAEISLKDNLSGQIGRINSSLGRLQGGVSQTGRGMGQLAGGLARVGAVAAGAAATGLGYAASKAISFEDAFTGVRKTVDATDLSKAGLSFDVLADKIREMSTRIPVAADDLARIAEAAGALGIAGGDIESFTEIVAKLGVTTNLSTDEAATALGQLGTTLHLRGDDFQEFADSLVALGNSGASTEAQIIDIATRFAAAGDAAGLSKEEILALSSATASMGINAEAAGSSLSRIFNSVTTNIGTSSKKAQVFADTLNLSAHEFKVAWERDALGTFQDFLGELGKVDKFKQANILKGIGITGTRDINAVQLMINNLKEVNRQLDVSRSGTGALGKEADKAFGSTANQIKLFKQNIDEAARTVGDALLPKINELAKRGTKWLQDNKVAISEFADKVGKAFDGFVDRLQGADFSGLIDGFKLLSGISKGILDTFLKLPPQIQAIAVAGLALNKISGGLLAKGIGNIAGGLLKIGLARGSSPANPLFVSAVGGGLGGPGALAGGQGGGLLANIGKIIGVAAVAEFAHEYGSGIAQAGADLHNSLGLPKLSLKELQWPLGEKNTPDWAYTLFGGTRPDPGRGAGGYFGPPGAVSSLVDPGILSHAASERADATAADAAAKASALTAKEFLAKLRTTAFIGAKDYKSIFERFSTHPDRGSDPYGKGFLRVLEHLKNPKAPKVAFEIKGHLAELRNLEKFYVQHGDRKAAAKVQGVIDRVKELLGIERRGHSRTENKLDRIPVGLRRVEGVDRDVVHATRDTAHKTALAVERIRGVEAGTKAVAGNTDAIKRQGPPNVTVGVSNIISVSTLSGVIQRQTYTTATGRQGGLIR